MIVIDVGCATYGGDYSVARLIEWYHPDVLYGFDPSPEFDARPPVREDAPTGPTKVTRLILEQKAAWIYDGEIGYRYDGLGSWVTDRPEAERVPCVDLARFISELPEDEIILKLDCEGAEFEILEHLIETEMHLRLSRVLMEWHPRRDDGPRRRRAIETALRNVAVIEQWRW